MPSSGLQQAAKVLGVASLFGVTSLVGSPIAGAMVTGVGGPVLDVVTREGLDYVLDKWTSSKHSVNNDLRQAMQRAFANATARLETQWWETDQAKRLTKARRVPIETFFDTFEQDIAWVFSDDQLSSLTRDIRALQTDTAARADIQQVITEQLRTYLRGFDDDALNHFMCGRLLAEAAICFTEELKTNDRAWRAWQLLLNEGLRASIADVSRTQHQAAVDAAQLRLLLEELRERGNELRWAQPEQRDPWGEEALLRVQDSLAKRIEAESQHTRKAVQREHEHTRATVIHGHEELREQLHGIELALTSLVKSDASLTAGELLQTATDHHRRIWNVPQSRNPNFVGRDEILNALSTAICHEGIPIVHAIVGMGGVGKSQLAAQFAYSRLNEFPIIWWIRAEEPATLIADATGLAAKMHLPLTAADSSVDIAAAIRTHLEHSKKRWLLIFDNAETPREIDPFLPRLGDGRVLITSRVHAWDHMAITLGVELLVEDAAISFLLQRTGQSDAASAQAIARELGRLPLALEQAAAYMSERGISLEGYLRLYRTHQSRLLGKTGGASEPTAPVATTWNVSISKVKDVSPAAVQLLQLCAFLAPERIPIDILRGAAIELPVRLRQQLEDPLETTEIAGVLYRYSLINVIDDNTVGVHRLVQLAIRDSLSPSKRKTWADIAIRLMYVLFRFDYQHPDTWPNCERLLPHVLAVCDYCAKVGTAISTIAALLTEAGQYLTRQYHLPLARQVLEQALEITEKLYGPDHIEVASPLNCLGDLLRRMRDLGAAQACLDRAIAIEESTYGPDHPATAMTLNRLGAVLRQLGNFALARSYLERASRINALAYQGAHLDVASVLNNLGIVLYDQGELDLALPNLERALAMRESLCGPRHPDVATTRSILGLVLLSLGDRSAAMAQQQEALAIYTAAYGTGHARVAKTRERISHIFRAMGDAESAQREMEYALAITQSAYGPSHSETATILFELALILHERGEIARAIMIMESALTIHRLHSDMDNAAAAERNLREFARQLENQAHSAIP